jgi:hypothetical protein
LTAVYLLQMVSPLRLNGDAIVLLSLGDSAAAGRGFYYRGGPTQFPHGYPMLVAGLDAMHIGASWSYIGLNYLFLGAGAIAAYLLLRRSLGLPSWTAAVISCMTLLSYVFIKHATLPLSDMPFFGLSMLAVLALWSCRETTGIHTAVQFSVALALVAAAIMVRTAGVALLPACLFALYQRLHRSGEPDRTLPRRWVRIAIVAGAGLLVIVFGAAFIMRTRYYREILNVLAHAPSEGGYVWLAIENSWTHLLELGEVSLNLPSSRIPAAMQFVMPFFGTFMLALTVCGVWLGRKIDLVVVYIASYALMLFLYVGYDARYWIPVVPLLMGLQARALLGSRTGRRAAMAYVALFAVAGAAALGYSTRLSLSGTRFAELYGNEALRGTYRVAFGLSAPKAEGFVNLEALQLLRRHGGLDR